MINVVFVLGYAQIDYDATCKAILGCYAKFYVANLAEVKAMIDQRLKVEDVKTLERCASQMMMEIPWLRELVKLQNRKICKSRSLLEAGYQDVARMAEMCKVLAIVWMDAGLYKAGILKSEVFKAENFKISIKFTIAYTKRMVDSNMVAMEVLEAVCNQIAEAGQYSTPTFDSPAKNPISLPQSF